MFSFWLARLNYISILLNITHQRLKLAQQYSIWNMSINRAVHYTGRLSIKKQHCYSCLPRHSEFILQYSVSVDFDSVCKVSEDSFSGNTAIAQRYKEQVYWDLSGTLTASPRQPCHMVSFLLAGFYETQELQLRNSSNKTSTGRVSKGNWVCFYETLMVILFSRMESCGNDYTKH